MSEKPLTTFRRSILQAIVQEWVDEDMDFTGRTLQCYVDRYWGWRPPLKQCRAMVDWAVDYYFDTYNPDDAPIEKGSV